MHWLFLLTPNTVVCLVAKGRLRQMEDDIKNRQLGDNRNFLCKQRQPQYYFVYITVAYQNTIMLPGTRKIVCCVGRWSVDTFQCSALPLTELNNLSMFLWTQIKMLGAINRYVQLYDNCHDDVDIRRMVAWHFRTFHNQGVYCVLMLLA
jgi:hypothetical protein